MCHGTFVKLSCLYYYIEWTGLWHLCLRQMTFMFDAFGINILCSVVKTQNIWTFSSDEPTYCFHILRSSLFYLNLLNSYAAFETYSFGWAILSFAIFMSGLFFFILG